MQNGKVISTEDCNCASSATTQTQLLQRSNANSNDAAKFTYDEGNGEKELILLTGPLSQAYTDALNIYYQKKPITGEFDEAIADAELTGQEKTVVAQSSVTSGVATETQAMDETMLTGLVSEIKHAHIEDDLSKYYNFRHEKEVFDGVQDHDKPVDVVEVIDPAHLTQIEYINKIQEKKPNPYTRFIYLVEAKNKGETQGVDVRKRFVNVRDIDPLSHFFGDIESQQAFEHLKETSHATFVFGMEGLITYLSNRLKSHE